MGHIKPQFRFMRFGNKTALHWTHKVQNRKCTILKKLLYFSVFIELGALWRRAFLLRCQYHTQFFFIIIFGIREDFWSNKCRCVNVKLLGLLLKINSYFILNDNSGSVYSRKWCCLACTCFLSTRSLQCYEFIQCDQNRVMILGACLWLNM